MSFSANLELCFCCTCWIKRRKGCGGKKIQEKNKRFCSLFFLPFARYLCTFTTTVISSVYIILGFRRTQAALSFYMPKGKPASLKAMTQRVSGGGQALSLLWHKHGERSSKHEAAAERSKSPSNLCSTQPGLYPRLASTNNASQQ